MSIVVQPSVNCPECGNLLSAKVLRSMNKFWTGIGSAECENCKASVEYHDSIQGKLSVGNRLFRWGALGVAVAIVLNLVSWEIFGYPLAIVSVASLVVGVLYTATKPDEIKVQLADGT